MKNYKKNQTRADERLQSEMAYKSGLQFQGKKQELKLYKPQQNLFDDTSWYVKKWSKNCQSCGMRLICNGCTFCEQCKNRVV